VLDIERQTLSALSFLPGLNSAPVWSPDGKYLVFRSYNPKGSGLYWISADGSGEAQRLSDGKWSETPQGISLDGKRLILVQEGEGTGFDIWSAPIEGDRDHPHLGKPEPFLRTQFSESHPALSPDGRWMAYMSDESGNTEIYVRPFPGPGGKWQISTGGGSYPIWSRNGHELFFRSPTGIMVTAYTTRGETFVPGKPAIWSTKDILTHRGNALYDLAPDGKRFVVFLEAEDAGERKPATEITFLLNFFDELGRRMPVGDK
jgi:serine/threonine-protein kinase